MILCLDVGNTDIDSVVFTQNGQSDVFNIPYERTMSPSGYRANILAALEKQGIYPGI
jgi:pantothenate kinase type III